MFLLIYFFFRGELTRANPSNGHESMLAERRVALNLGSISIPLQ